MRAASSTSAAATLLCDDDATGGLLLDQLPERPLLRKQIGVGTRKISPNYPGILARKPLHLLQADIARDVAAAVNVKGCTVLEVGAGLGLLTRAMLDAGAERIIVVEPMRRAQAALKELAQEAPGQVIVHEGSLEKLDLDNGCLPSSELLNGIPRVPWKTVHPTFKIVGNPPVSYGLRFWLSWLYKVASRYGPYHLGRVQACLMYPEYYVEKLIANPGSDKYGRPAALNQILCESRVLRTYDRQEFDPAIHVGSPQNHAKAIQRGCDKLQQCLVELTPRAKTGLIEHDASGLDYVLQRLFMLHKLPLERNIGTLGGGAKHLLARAGLNKDIKPQHLTPSELVGLVNAFVKWEHRPACSHLEVEAGFGVVSEAEDDTADESPDDAADGSPDNATASQAWL